MPNSDREQAKQVILEIVRRCGGEFEGKTKLYKTFYLAHLYYAGEAPGYLTEWPIVRMPHGPGIDCGDALLHELVTEGALSAEPHRIGPYISTKYRVVQGFDSGQTFDEVALQSIQSAIDFALTRSASQLSELTHEQSRSWNSTPDGSILNIYLDLIPDEEYDERRGQLQTLRDEIAAAFGDAGF